MWWWTAALIVIASAVTCHRDESEPPVSDCQPRPGHQLAAHEVALEGGRVVLRCALDARRAATTWSHVDSRRMLSMTINSFTYVEPGYRLVNVTRPWPHWVLMIERARTADAGLYRCSVIYEEARPDGAPTSLLVQLTVLSRQRTVIGGPRCRHVHAGQPLRISCAANATGREVTWTRDDVELATDSEGRVTVDRGPLCSLLTVQDTRPADAGTYRCQVPGLSSASVRVDVVPRAREERPHAQNASGALKECAYTAVFLSITIAAGLRYIYSVN